MRRLKWLLLLALAPHACLVAGSESAYEQASRVELRTVEEAMQGARQRRQGEGTRQTAPGEGLAAHARRHELLHR